MVPILELLRFWQELHIGVNVYKIKQQCKLIWRQLWNSVLRNDESTITVYKYEYYKQLSLIDCIFLPQSQSHAVVEVHPTELTAVTTASLKLPVSAGVAAGTRLSVMRRGVFNQHRCFGPQPETVQLRRCPRRRNHSATSAARRTE